jgi:hypothetical protein
MGDVRPNYVIEKKRMELDVDRQKLNIKQMELRLLELDDEKNKLNISIESTTKSIEELQNKIAAFQINP